MCPRPIVPRSSADQSVWALTDLHFSDTLQKYMIQFLTALQLQLDPAAPDVVAFVGGGGKSSALFRLASEIVAVGQRVVVTTTTHISYAQLLREPVHVFAPGADLPLDAIAQALDKHGRCLVVAEAAPDKVRGIAPALVDQLVAHAQTLQIGAIVIEADGSRYLPIKAPADHEPALPAATTLLVPVMGLDALGAPLDEAHVHRVAQVRSLLKLTPADTQIRLTPRMAAQLLIDPQGGAKLLPAGARLLPLINKADQVTSLAGARLIARQLAAWGYRSLIGAVGRGLTPQPPRRLEGEGEKSGLSTGRSSDGAALGPSVLERWSPLAAVILAAGRSSRMGRPKQLEAVDGEPMVVRAVHTALQSDVAQVIVVTGAYVDAVTALLTPLLEQTGDRLRLVHNPDWQTGQASSIRAAIAALPAPIGAALFLPTDQPFVPPVLLQQLIRAWRSGARLVAPLVDGQVRGAPALFDRNLWPEMLTLTGDIGARPLLQKHQSDVVTLPVSAHLLRDIDTPQDLV